MCCTDGEQGSVGSESRYKGMSALGPISGFLAVATALIGQSLIASRSNYLCVGTHALFMGLAFHLPVKGAYAW